MNKLAVGGVDNDIDPFGGHVSEDSLEETLAISLFAQDFHVHGEIIGTTHAAAHYWRPWAWPWQRTVRLFP